MIRKMLSLLLIFLSLFTTVVDKAEATPDLLPSPYHKHDSPMGLNEIPFLHVGHQHQISSSNNFELSKNCGAQEEEEEENDAPQDPHHCHCGHFDTFLSSPSQVKSHVSSKLHLYLENQRTWTSPVLGLIKPPQIA